MCLVLRGALHLGARPDSPDSYVASGRSFILAGDQKFRGGRKDDGTTRENPGKAGDVNVMPRESHLPQNGNSPSEVILVEPK
jgi:hypothetical protein